MPPPAAQSTGREPSPSRDDLAKRFRSLQTLEDVAELLGIAPPTLRYYLYGVRLPDRYRRVSIRKRNGGQRELQIPPSRIAALQSLLQPYLAAAYEPNASVHGYVTKRSIKTNALSHAKRKWILTVDLQSFFPSIHLGRVRGMLMNRPYSLGKAAATVIAQLCCANGLLSQGAATSPDISNMICARLDDDLRRLARQHGCFYTRYADDIAFSSDRREFPSAIATSVGHAVGAGVEIGADLHAAISQNGFVLNGEKTRLQAKYHRQRVTGLTVSAGFPNCRRTIRQVRAMLNAWAVYGLESAESEFLAKYDHRNRKPGTRPTFDAVIKGRLAYIKMVRGEHCVVYRNLVNRLSQLDSAVSRVSPSSVPDALSEALAPLREAFSTLKSETNRQKAGLAFEKLLWGLFSAYDLDPKASFSVNGQQIDGSFLFNNDVIIVEAKWQKKSTSTADIGNFHTKVQDRANAKGLFISINGYSAETLKHVNTGRSPRFVMLDGTDLEKVLLGEQTLPDLLSDAFRALGESGHPRAKPRPAARR